MTQSFTKTTVFFSLALLALGVALPVPQLVFCKGDDGHFGLEFAHAETGCSDSHDCSSCEVVVTECCTSDNQSTAPDGNCCQASSCEDTELPSSAAVISAKAKAAKDSVPAAQVHFQVLHLDSFVNAPPQLASAPPGMPTLLRSSVLRI